jgi:hypothetical protein
LFAAADDEEEGDDDDDDDDDADVGEAGGEALEPRRFSSTLMPHDENSLNWPRSFMLRMSASRSFVPRRPCDGEPDGLPPAAAAAAVAIVAAAAPPADSDDSASGDDGVPLRPSTRPRWPPAASPPAAPAGLASGVEVVVLGCCRVRGAR